MSNGLAARTASIAGSRVSTALLLASLIASTGGCDTTAAPQPPARPAIVTAESLLSPDARSRIDPARKRLWVLAHDRVVLHDIATSRKIEIDLPGWQWADNQYACPPDIALGPTGEAIVTSNVISTLWRIDPETLAVTVHEVALDATRGREVGFSGLVYSAQHGAFLAVNDTHSSLWRIDLSLKTGYEVRLSESIRETGTCEAPLSRVQREAD